MATLLNFGIKMIHVSKMWSGTIHVIYVLSLNFATNITQKLGAFKSSLTILLFEKRDEQLSNIIAS